MRVQPPCIAEGWACVVDAEGTKSEVSSLQAQQSIRAAVGLRGRLCDVFAAADLLVVGVVTTANRSCVFFSLAEIQHMQQSKKGTQQSSV